MSHLECKVPNLNENIKIDSFDINSNNGPEKNNEKNNKNIREEQNQLNQQRNVDLKNYISDFRRKHFSNIPDIFFLKIKLSLDCLHEALMNNSNFDTKNIFLSFNGGKDCLAAYIILKYYLFCKEKNIQYSNKNSFDIFIQQKNEALINSKKIKFVYFLNKKNFESEEDYVVNFSKKENVEIFYIHGDYILGLNFLIQNFSLKFILMGTRLNDMKQNNNNLNKEDLIHESTAPYPHFFRFYPVYKFEYEDIWRLILISNFDYLGLYDIGFSSIGNKLNTKINRNLIYKETGNVKNDDVSYDEQELLLPAWCLKSGESERSFREESK